MYNFPGYVHTISKYVQERIVWHMLKLNSCISLKSENCYGLFKIILFLSVPRKRKYPNTLALLSLYNFLKPTQYLKKSFENVRHQTGKAL